MGTSIRVRHFDTKVARFLDATDNPVIINVGCGLDTRFNRLRPSKGVFYDLDLPQVVDFRNAVLPPSEHNPCLAASLFETDWLEELVRRHEGARFAVVMEGVLMYFEEDQVREALAGMAERIPHGELHFDVSSSWMVGNTHKHETVKLTNATFKWGLDDNRQPERWSNRLHFVESTGYFDTQLARWGMIGLIGRMIPRYNQAFRMLHYEIR
ncbi:MAG: class I SAM-dependent methyltransferase [Desulfovibrionaceae bacterium]